MAVWEQQQGVEEAVDHNVLASLLSGKYIKFVREMSGNSIGLFEWEP